MVSTCRGKQLRTRELLRPPVTWCEHTRGRALSEHIAHSLCFLPPQQKMAQKIMKMIQGDFIEKPDFALKSIGKWLPLAPRTPTICPHQVSPETLQRTDFSSGLEHSAPRKFTVRANCCPSHPYGFLATLFCCLEGGAEAGKGGSRPTTLPPTHHPPYPEASRAAPAPRRGD